MTESFTMNNPAWSFI